MSLPLINRQLNSGFRGKDDEETMHVTRELKHFRIMEAQISLSSESPSSPGVNTWKREEGEPKTLLFLNLPLYIPDPLTDATTDLGRRELTTLPGLPAVEEEELSS